MHPILVREVCLRSDLQPIEVIQFPDGSTGATVRSLCRLLGISRQGQVQRIKRTPELMVAFIQVSVATPAGPRLFDVLLDYAISIWAIGIDAGRLEPHQQERVALIKEDAVEAIKRAFSDQDDSAVMEELPPAIDAWEQVQAGLAAIAAGIEQTQVGLRQAQDGFGQVQAGVSQLQRAFIALAQEQQMLLARLAALECSRTILRGASHTP